MFIVDLTYKAPADIVAAHRPAHRAWLDIHYAGGLFLASGPKPDGSGGVIIVGEAIDEGALERLLQDDPFAREAIATYAITTFTAVKSTPAIAGFLAQAA